MAAAFRSSFQFCMKKCDRVAYVLVLESKKTSSNMIWMEESLHGWHCWRPCTLLTRNYSLICEDYLSNANAKVVLSPNNIMTFIQIN